MEQLCTYALSDFIAFSSETYLRLFARLNAELTALVFAAWIMGLAMALLALRASPTRLALAVPTSRAGGCHY